MKVARSPLGSMQRSTDVWCILYSTARKGAVRRARTCHSLTHARGRAGSVRELTPPDKLWQMTLRGKTWRVEPSSGRASITSHQPHQQYSRVMHDLGTSE